MNMESQIQNINVDLIIPNRFQPRLSFDEQALNDLSKSIKEHGIIQPLVVRRLNDKYEIIAGERRYKAAVQAGFTTVPVIVTDIDDNQSAEVALVENVQRKNLNSMEEARSYKKILDKGYLTQEALAQKMGISQSTLANKLRLLSLAPEVQEALMNNKISERHARSLLLVNDNFKQINLLNRIITERLTVRQLDQIIKEENSRADDSSHGGAREISIINEPRDSVNQLETTSSLETTIVKPVGSNATLPNDTFENKSLVETLEPDVNQVITQTDNNIFDVSPNKSVVDNQETELLTENIFDSPNTEPVSSVMETLDSVENTENKKNPNGIFGMFKAPSFSSLEDEVTNLSVDNDITPKEEEYFNPFSNMEEINDYPLESLTDDVLNESDPQALVAVPEPIVKKGDLSSVKKAYDNLKAEIEAAGFKISTEDFDFEDIYQLIIKIDKQDE